MLRLATWNVNSIRIRLGLLEKLVRDENPDIVCLQEVKAKEADFPFDEVRRIGFEHIALYSIPGYNGVAILSKFPFTNIKKHKHVKKDDARHISVFINGIELHNIYIPAGGDIPDETANPSFAHKLAFVEELSSFFEKKNNKKQIVCGDFNIAPLENDVWNHKLMSKVISHTPKEIEKLQNFFQKGDFVDAVRSVFPEPEKIYSWWSYRNPNWQKNDKGRRLDHIWTDKILAKSILDIKIAKDFRAMERPSDHVPIVADLKI